MKFNSYQRACGWQRIYGRLSDELSETEAVGICTEALALYEKFAAGHTGAKGISRLHIMSAIAEGALYLPLRDKVGAERAIELLTEGARPLSEAKHKKIEHLPPALFMKAAGVISNTMFGEKAGFRRQRLCNTAAEKRYDLLSCPYAETLAEMG